MKLYNCDKCGVDIHLNEPYISITHNKEVLRHDIVNQRDTIEVKKSTQINIFCGKCGNQHPPLALAESLALVKIGFKEIKPIEVEKQFSEETILKS